MIKFLKFLGTLGYFFFIVLLAGVLMILASRALSDMQIYWALKQAAPSFILISVLFLGLSIYDRTAMMVVAHTWGRSIGWKEVMVAALLGMTFFALSITVTYLVEGRVTNNAVYHTLTPALFWPHLILAVIFTGLGQPVIEEIIFRGRIFDAANQALNVVLSCAVVSLVFAALHYKHMHASFIFSLALCVVRMKHGLRLCVLIHIIFNLISILFDAI